VPAAEESLPWLCPGHICFEIGPVEQRMEVTGVNLPLVSFRYTYGSLDDNTELTSDSALRFRDRDGVSASLQTEGFTVEDIRDTPDRPGREFVFVAGRPLTEMQSRRALCPAASEAERPGLP
jgi:hypothetical protein